MKDLRILFFVAISFVISGCSGYYDLYPAADYDEDDMWSDITRAQQYLNSIYSGVPTTPDYALDYYTDNAVSIDGEQWPAVSGYTSANSPVADNWGLAIAKIIEVNRYLKYGFDVSYDAYSEEKSEELKKRSKGEAYGLRAYYKWILLKNFAGPADDDTMLGIPLFDDKELSVDNVNSIPRATYMQSYDSIMADIDKALTYIDFLRYDGSGFADGAMHTARVSGEMLYALKARVALFAASAAYEQISWATAAAITYESIKQIDHNELLDLQPFGLYNDVSATTNITTNPDDLWRSTFKNGSEIDKANLPPSLYGAGECNPSQNLVDAFPNINGEYLSAEDPSTNRDKRFANYIFANGASAMGDRTVYIQSYIGGFDGDGGYLVNATRTGYYMKRFMSTSINLDPTISSTKSASKFNVIFDRAGLYLDFAEAATHACGAEGTTIATDNGESIAMPFTALEAMQKIRTKAGITNDTFIATAAADPAEFLSLVANERRLEMCFTGERYYDVRRLMLPSEELKAPIMGQTIVKNGGICDFTSKEVESRYFEDYMYYNPIPQSEIANSNALIQNRGW